MKISIDYTRLKPEQLASIALSAVARRDKVEIERIIAAFRLLERSPSDPELFERLLSGMLMANAWGVHYLQALASYWKLLAVCEENESPRVRALIFKYASALSAYEAAANQFAEKLGISKEVFIALSDVELDPASQISEPDSEIIDSILELFR